jgi:hypothetical protein
MRNLVIAVLFAVAGLFGVTMIVAAGTAMADLSMYARH